MFSVREALKKPSLVKVTSPFAGEVKVTLKAPLASVVCVIAPPTATSAKTAPESKLVTVPLTTYTGAGQLTVVALGIITSPDSES